MGYCLYAFKVPGNCREVDDIDAEWELGVCDVGLGLIIASHILLQQLGAHLERIGSNGHSTAGNPIN